MRGWGIALCMSAGAATAAAACGLSNAGLETVAADAGGDDVSVTMDGFVDAPSAEGAANDAAAPPGDGGGPVDAGGDIDFDSPPPRPPDASPAPLDYDGGAVVDPDLADQDWVPFCVGLAGCGEVPSISRCLGQRPQPSQAEPLLPPPSMIQCVGNAASDCTQVAKCVGGGGACSATSPASCSSNLLSTCRWGFLAEIDCGELGMVCSPGIGNAGCGFGDCAAWQQGQRYCAGQYLVVCDHGRYTPAVDCGVFGGTCGGAPPAAQCVGSGSSCTGSAPTCSGSSIDVCLGGLLGSADCSKLYDPSFQCFPGATTGSAPVCARGTTCAPTNADACDNPGHNAQFCNAGAPDTYDCTQKNLGWQQNCLGGKCSN